MRSTWYRTDRRVKVGDDSHMTRTWENIEGTTDVSTDVLLFGLYGADRRKLNKIKPERSTFVKGGPRLVPKAPKVLTVESLHEFAAKFGGI